MFSQAACLPQPRVDYSGGGNALLLSQGFFFLFLSCFGFFLVKGPYFVIPSALILVRRNPTSKIWEGMGDGHHQSPLGWVGWFFGGIGWGK